MTKVFVEQPRLHRSVTRQDTDGKLNKIMHIKDTLMYKDRDDPNIGIGVLGMINDDVGISECGMDSFVKNAIKNAFVDAQRLEIHTDKSMVTHIGRSIKCDQSFPKIEVHKNQMPEVQKIKYLGNITSSTGGN